MSWWQDEGAIVLAGLDLLNIPMRAKKQFREGSPDGRNRRTFTITKIEWWRDAVTPRLPQARGFLGIARYFSGLTVLGHKIQDAGKSGPGMNEISREFLIDFVVYCAQHKVAVTTHPTPHDHLFLYANSR